MKTADYRSKEVQGVSFSAFVSAAKLFDALPASDLKRFETAMVAHTRQTVADVRERVNVNTLWDQIISAFKIGLFGRTAAEVGAFFRVQEKSTSPHPPGYPSQTSEKLGVEAPDWVSYWLYFDYGSIEMVLKRFLSQSHEGMVLSRMDVRDQMAANTYWVTGKHTVRFAWNAKESVGGTSKAWCLAADNHPMGLQRVSDEELLQSIQTALAAPGVQKWKDKWLDPRKGELFLIIDLLMKEQTEKEAKEQQETKEMYR